VVSRGPDKDALRDSTPKQAKGDKGATAGMGLCGGNRSDFDKCLNKQFETKRLRSRLKFDSDNQAISKNRNFGKATVEAADARREAEKAWSNRR